MSVCGGRLFYTFFPTGRLVATASCDRAPIDRGTRSPCSLLRRFRGDPPVGSPEPRVRRQGKNRRSGHSTGTKNKRTTVECCDQAA